MERLILVDGSSLLSTSFFGNVPRAYYNAKTEEDRNEVLKKIMQTSSGIYTNAVYTMSKILLKIIKNQKPSHMAVAWDITRNTFRREIYPLYKANRAETKPELREQYGTMQQVLDAMNILQFKFDRYEADDILGTLAKKFEQQLPIYIMSKDQDVLQLVSDDTRVWLITSKADDMYKQVNISKEDRVNIPDNVFEFTPLYVEEFYGVKPLQIVDKKALEGDKSDNIPGVRGVGEKAVIPLLKEYGTVENIYELIEGLSKSEEKELKEFFKKSLGISRSPISYLLKEAQNDEELSAKESAFISKRLATICTSIQELQSVTLDDLVLKIDEDGMEKIFQELEFKSLLKSA